MAIFKFVISDPASRRSFQTEVDQSKASGLMGKKIGEEFNGDFIGLVGYVMQVTGGTDKDGFPMHPTLKGSGRKKLLLTEAPGFHPKIKGQRRRKMVRGNTISDSIVQINAKIVKAGEKPLDQIIPKKEKKEEKKEETKEEKKEEKPETKKEEKPKEEKPTEKTKPAEKEKPVEKEKPTEKPKA